jgi:hypothetical protein
VLVVARPRFETDLGPGEESREHGRRDASARVVRRFKNRAAEVLEVMPARLAAALEIADISGACDRRRRALIVATGARSVIPSRSIEHVGPP